MHVRTRAPAMLPGIQVWRVSHFAIPTDSPTSHMRDAVAVGAHKNGQRGISEIWRYGAASRARSAVSPDAITAVSNSSAVATTKASTAFAEDIRVRARRAPA